MIKVKRVYDPAAPEDGLRVLVDRLWPRGLSRERAQVNLWLKDVAPDSELRKWFSHDPEKWPEFKRRYFAELATQTDLLATIAEEARDGVVTILYGAKDRQHNNALALKEYMETYVLGSTSRYGLPAREGGA
ncbi:MAG TPA: DUF488 domain-containing protein [Candidatus Bipolaricaulis anaerobius]|jgi:uncharacterized protein YeaO (DUF488 family)|nr:DUF488 domain-containing protein [Candidatus Bipolaricaulis anaerobius]HNS24114.1 DUF488 domain-containing protein [Candidatus Bipolaricaulis anaerobius]